MPRVIRSALATRGRARGARPHLTGVTPLLSCGTVLPVILAGFHVQLSAFVAPRLLVEWRLEPTDLATPLAMAPAGLLLGAAAGRSARHRLDALRGLASSGLVAAIATGAAAFTRTPVAFAALWLVASVAHGVSLGLAGGVVPRSAAGWQRARAGATTAFFAAGGILACWLAALVVSPGWRGAVVVGGGMTLAMPLVLLLAWLRRAPLVLQGASGDQPGERRSSSAPRPTFGSLIGAPHGRATMTLFVLLALNAMAASMALFLAPLSAEQSGSMPLAVWTLGPMHAAAAGGALLAGRVANGVGARRALPGALGLAATGALTLAFADAPAGGLRLAALVCGATMAGAHVIALALAPAAGPDAVRREVASAAASFTALGAVVGAYTGTYAWSAAGLPAVFAAWAGCLSLAALAALTLPTLHVVPVDRSCPEPPAGTVAVR